MSQGAQLACTCLRPSRTVYTHYLATLVYRRGKNRVTQGPECLVLPDRRRKHDYLSISDMPVCDCLLVYLCVPV